MREAKKAEARAARAEIEKKYSLARRSRRFLHLVSDDCSRVDEDSTSRDTCMLESSTRTQSTETTTAAQNATSSSRKERLKRRLIRSLDYAVMTCSRLPLTRIPLDCYLSPDCEGHEEVIENHFLIPNINVSRWPGPYFDWLSTVHPSASPYLPQSGDSIVYLYRGHKDYLSKAWESGNLPLMESTDRQETSNSPELPWIVWPDIPQYLCCVVRKITYHIVRIAGSHSNASRSSLHFKKKTRKHSYTKCLRQSHQLINLRDLNSSCHKEQKLSSSSSSVKQDCPIPSTSFDSNYSSPSSLSLNSGDSFVRLITLELQIEQEQPYSSFSYKKLTDGDRDHHGKRPETIHVTYHDVDGILEFIFLRRIFDTALQRKWKPGDVFICPVGNSWWRGCVVKNLFDNDLSTLKPSTSSVDVKTFTYSLTTSYLVRWLDENESIGGTLKCDSYSLKNDNSLLRISNIGSISLDKLPENIDHLNAWDMYKWYPERGYVDDTPNDSSTDSEFTLFGGLTDGYVYISHEQLCLLYGTSKFWDATNQSVGYLSEIKRLVECILQIMQLDISEDFIKPVDLAAYPDYLFINAFPVDLNFILNRLLNGFYRQPASVKSDFEQLLENTERYNLPESSIVHNAQLVCQLGLYCIENNVTSSDVQKRYTFLNLPNPLPESSEKVNFVTATPSLSPRGDYQVVRSRVRTRTFCTDRRRKLASRCHSSNRRSEIRRRKSSRLTHSLSKHSTEKHLSGSNSSAYGYSYNFKRKMSLREKGPPKKHNNLSSPSASWVPGTLNLIQELCSHQRSFYFRSPINPVEYPDYHSIVEHPMDLSTIQKKLINSQSSSQSPTKYHVRSRIQQEYSFSDLLTDLELIVSNAKLYNTDPDTQVFDDTLWLENWVNEVMKTHLSTVIESPSLKSLSRPGVLSGRVKSPRFDKSAPSVNCKNLRKRSFPTKSMNTSGDKKVEVNSGIISPLSGGNIASSSLAQSTTVRTSSGRIVKPPPRSVQDMSFSVSDDYDQKSDCSRVEHKKSHHSTNRPASCSSKKTMHPVNKLYSKYAKRKRSVVKHSQSTKLSNTSSEELWNTSLRRSTRKRKIVPNFDQYYASSEGYEEYE
ncbi:unnamed protein product [Heterobilharzia americana]|nr:unnamed protein product [Heterobilharzia americana]